MEVFWNYLLVFAMIAVGFMLYAFGFMQVLISLFCTIPTTKAFNTGDYFIDTKGIYKQCAKTIVVWLIIIGIVVALVFMFGNGWAIYGFLFGIAVGFFSSLGKWGRTPSNLLDYLTAFRRYYPEKFYADLAEDFRVKGASD